MQIEISEETVTALDSDTMFYKGSYIYKQSMLSGSLVTTAWRVLRLRIEEEASTYGG
jgi:hypothetical protein